MNLKINDVNFQKEVLEAKIPVLVDFFAEWCGPCQMVGPILEELASQYQDKVKFVKLDIDENQKIAEKYNVLSVPTVIGFKNGEEMVRQVGLVSKSDYEKIIKRL